MLNKIKLILELTDTSKDDLILALIERCTEELIAYTHNDSTAGMENCICSMVIYNYNRLGTEGVNSEDYSGVSFGYSSDYPDNIVRLMKAHRKLVLC